VEHSELVSKVEQWLNDVSSALHRLSREREVLRETRTQMMMGVLSAEQAETNLSRLTRWRDEDRRGLTDVLAGLRLPVVGDLRAGIRLVFHRRRDSADDRSLCHRGRQTRHQPMASLIAGFCLTAIGIVMLTAERWLTARSLSRSAP
jgi:hypothetical protein